MSTSDEPARPRPERGPRPSTGSSLSFGGLRALSELDLHVDDGEVVSVIGPNGAGKSTVFNVITGVYEPSAGTSASPGSPSPGSCRTASPGWGSRARSRACGCS